MKNFRSIFWFRQDLRVFDNIGLFECVKNSEFILPIFVIDENIITDLGGEDKRFLFVYEALRELKKQLQEKGADLLVLRGQPENILVNLVEKYNIDAVFSNKSYNRYGVSRDKKIQDILEKKGKSFDLYHDFLVVPPENIEQRKVYTPFYKRWRTYIDERGLKLKDVEQITYLEHNEHSENIEHPFHPYFSFELCREKLTTFDFGKYDQTRDFLGTDGTSKLSPFIRFGCISVRWLYKRLEYENEIYIKELAWREFWYHINHYFPETKKLEFQEKRRYLDWQKNKDMLEKIENAQTGYPIVDASIRQLKEENWLHGRCRMILGSFITKNLLFDWRLGEKFFKKYLLDYDESVNFGNWQWIASVGADPKPVRIFNPILQSQRFDPDGKYILKYIPELKNEEIEKIHDPCKYKLDYISPIVDQKESYKRAKEFYSHKNKIYGSKIL